MMKYAQSSECVLNAYRCALQIIPPGAEHYALRYTTRKFAADDVRVPHIRDGSEGRTPFVGSRLQLQRLDRERQRKGLRLRRYKGNIEVVDAPSRLSIILRHTSKCFCVYLCVSICVCVCVCVCVRARSE
jgi:hypothetical protein